MEEGEHGAGCFVDDVPDQVERVIGALPERHERYVGVLAAGRLADLVGPGARGER